MGEKVGEIQDFWTKFLMSVTMKIGYKFRQKWGKRRTKIFMCQQQNEGKWITKNFEREVVRTLS